MGIANQSGPQDGPAIAASHLDDARGAEVMMSFRVWPDAATDGAAFKETPKFTTAFRWLREVPDASMQVSFRWLAGDREGDGCVTYAAAWHPTATARTAQESIRNMITVAIADALAAGRFIRLDPEDIDEARAAQQALTRGPDRR